MTMQRFAIDIMSRAIGADGFIVVADIDENMRMIKRRLRAHAHEFARADGNLRDARLIVEMRN